MGATICRPYFWRYARGQTNTHTDTHVQTDRQTRTSQYSAPLWGAAKNYIKTDETIEVVVCCVDSGGLRLLRPRIRWGSIIPTKMGTFKRHDCASPDLSAVDILYIIRKRAAAMQLWISAWRSG